MCAENRLVYSSPSVYKVGKKHGVEIGIGKMDRRKNTFRKATVAGILLCFLSVLFTGCLISKEELNEQEKWVDQMNSAFTDDHFEYVRPGFDSLGGQSENEALVRSEKYPGEEIFIRETENSLITDYNSVRYKNEAENYVFEYFSGKFKCDDLQVRYSNNTRFTPIKDLSCDEFIQNYVHLDRVEIIICQKDGNFPDKEVMNEEIIGICKERDEICSFQIYCCKDKSSFEDAEKNCECVYSLCMYEERKIEYIRYEDKESSNVSFLTRDYTW